MSSTYSTNLALELIGTGDQAGNWGSTTNTNLGTLLEQAVSGYVTQGVTTGTDTTLAMTNGASATARNMFIELTGTGGTSTNLIVPANKKLYFIYNNTTGAVTVKVTGLTGVSVPAAAKVVLVSNGTDIVTATNYMASATLPSATLSSPTMTGTPVAPTASAGTNTTQVATTAFATTAAAAAFPIGGIIMWSGSIASIPSGWLLCNGSSGTPDLRDRFIVGAGSTYAVAATGGSANAVVVDHTHTATTTSTDAGHTHSSAFRAQTFAVTGSTIQAWEGFTYTPTTTGYAQITSSTTVANAGVSGTNANLPPYYALAYIMKV